jgi:hypothetical protein
MDMSHAIIYEYYPIQQIVGAWHPVSFTDNREALKNRTLSNLHILM